MAVRAGAAFVPAGAVQTATQDRVIYLVQGTNELGVWNSVVVTELNPVDSATAQAQLTLPALAAQWTWHTFRTDDSLNTDNRDFIRMTVAPH